MICVSLANLEFTECLAALEEETFAEIRLDRMALTLAQVTEIFSKPVQMIATCRPGKYSDRQRKKLFMTAINAGVAYIDVELEARKGFQQEIIEYAHEHNCKVITSYHNFETTPPAKKLESIARKCFKTGADIAKIVTTVKNNEDKANILSLYSLNKNIVAFGMGNEGKITRIIAPLMGAPFTYASQTKGREVAPGQIDKYNLSELITRLRSI